MVQEIIDNVYIKKDKNDYINEVIIQTKKNNFYYVQIFGFEKINSTEAESYILYEEYNLKGLKIINVGSNGASILIELSNKTFFEFQINGMEDNAYYLNILGEDAYEQIKIFFSKEMQKLSIKNNYAKF